MSDFTVIGSLTLTHEPIHESDDPAVRYNIQKGYDRLHQPHPPTNFDEWLQTQIIQYPDVPQFHNYLAGYYQKIGDEKRHKQAVEEMCKVFPDYLFSKIMKCRLALDNGEQEVVEQLLGEDLDLAALYPDRSVFHEIEFMNFQMVAAQYLIEKGNLDEAENRIDQMKRVDEGHPMIFSLGMRLAAKRMQELQDYYQNDVQTTDGSYDKEVQTNQAPSFHHPEMLQLYEHDLSIDPEILRNILSLPRETLIQDLELVAKDSIYRYEFFQNQIEAEGYQNEKYSSVFHALYLLAELGSENSLEVLLYLLRQGSEYLDNTFGDFLLESYWKFLYKIGEHQLHVLKDFLLEKNIYTYARVTLTSMLTQLGLHQPERLEEITSLVQEVLSYFLAHQDDDSLIDHFVIADLISMTGTLDLQGLDDIIQSLFEADIVDVTVVGDWEGYQQEKADGLYASSYKIELRGIFDEYEHITNTWHGYTSDPETEEIDWDSNNFFVEDDWDTEDEIWDMPPTLKPPVTAIADSYKRSTPKVGRNEPCPCGSGKKYKKCCMRR